MSSEHPHRLSESIQLDDTKHQASTWFALMQGGSPSQSDRDELKAWLEADPRHAQAFAHLEKLWNASAIAVPHNLATPKASPPASRPATLSRRRFVGFGVAACASAVAISASTLWLKGVSSPFADLRTAVGERRTVQLPDGSTVELAGNTALNLDFSSAQRSVKLIHGEAFFDVSPAGFAALSIQTQAGQVIAFEGEFCLSCDSKTSTVTVSRRAVRVITANQQIDISERQSLQFSTAQIGTIEHADIDQVLAWRNGRLVFFDTPLITVASELQRWREGRIFIPDPQLAARRVSLILNLNRPDRMLDALAKALAVRTTRYTDLITVIHSV